MAARFDTHQLYAGKPGAAFAAMTRAAAIVPVDGRARFALAGGRAL